MTDQPHKEPAAARKPALGPVKSMGLRHSWFDQEPRHSVPPPSTSVPPPPPLPSRGRALFSGIVGGAIAGACGIVLARVVAQRSGVDLFDGVARAITRGRVGSVPAEAWAIGAALLAGVVLGTLVALITRHVRRALPVAIFGAVFAPIAWLAVHVSLAKTHPWLATMIPIAPMLAGCALFGLLLALVVPIRGRG